MMVTATVLRRRLTFLPVTLLMVLCLAPVHAEEPSAQGKVLTMTGLKRDPATATTETIKFTGLKRRSAEIGPAGTEKNDK